jgi:hypothetical protein
MTAEVFVTPAIEAQAQIVKPPVAEDGAVVAIHAPRLPPKEVEAEDLRIGERRLVTNHEAVESRPPRHYRPFEAGHCLDHLRERDRFIRKGLLEKFAIPRASLQEADDSVAVGGHLRWVGQRFLHLLLQAAGPAIPKQGRLKRDVSDRRRVSIRGATMRLTDGPTVGPAEVWLVAGDAGHLAVGREAGVKKQQPAEFRLRGIEGVGLRMCGLRQEADLPPIDPRIDMGRRPRGRLAAVGTA